jgi:plastocyanin
MDGDRVRAVPTAVLATVVPIIAIVTVVVTLRITSTPAPSASTGGGSAISIKDFTFSPPSFAAKSGATVTVANDDGTAHTVTADDGSFDTGDIDGGAHATITLRGPGTYTYHCDIHNYMTGKITVR